jgi:CHAD domain-containing protein
MLSPSEVGHDLTLYAQLWLEERMRLTCRLAEAVAKKPSARAVHDVRVACRRLREAIEFFRGVPEVPALSDVDRAARALARSVRRLRELDVAQKRLEKLAAPDAESAEAREKLARVFAKRRKKLRRDRRRKIEKRAAEFVTAAREHLPLCDKPRATPPDRARESHLLAFAESRVAEKRALVESLFDDVRLQTGGKGAKARAGRLHAVRVAIKHWRYAGEIARAVMPRVLYRPMASRLRVLQERGGKSQEFSDLERLTRDELQRAGLPERDGRRMLSAIRALHRDAAKEFVDALAARLPRGEAASAG